MPNPLNGPASSLAGQDEFYPIRTVSSLTGVNPITLRAWERRYGLITPVRTPKGHRVYTQNDIDLIHQIVTLLEKGISIGQVKEKLQQNSAPYLNPKKTTPWVSYQRRMLNAVTRFDVAALDHAYNDALSLYSVERVTRDLVLPLLKILGERWASADGSVAEEHFFGAYLRNKLGARFHHQSIRTSGPQIVAACLPGEYHEVGLMLFCLSAYAQGYRVIYLGADTPLNELIEPAQRTAADAVLLSGSLDVSNEILNTQLPQLVKQLSIPVFIGGRSAVKYNDAILAVNATPLGTDIPQAIKHLNTVLGIPNNR